MTVTLTSTTTSDDVVRTPSARGPVAPSRGTLQPLRLDQVAVTAQGAERLNEASRELTVVT